VLAPFERLDRGALSRRVGQRGVAQVVDHDAGRDRHLRAGIGVLGGQLLGVDGLQRHTVDDEPAGEPGLEIDDHLAPGEHLGGPVDGIDAFDRVGQVVEVAPRLGGDQRVADQHQAERDAEAGEQQLDVDRTASERDWHAAIMPGATPGETRGGSVVRRHGQ
jgi:hypothetical protein